MGKKKILNTINKIALYLVAIGALNWLLVALLQFDLVAKLLGTSTLATWTYGLIGASGFWIGLQALLGKVTIK